MAEKLNINKARLTLQQLKTERNKAMDKYKIIIKQHKVLRKTFLEDLAESLEEEGKGTKANLMRNMIQISRWTLRLLRPQ